MKKFDWKLFFIVVLFLISMFLLLGKPIISRIEFRTDRDRIRDQILESLRPTEKITLTEVTPTEVTPTEVTPTEVTPTEVTPTEVTPTEVTPTEVTPTEVTPTEATSSENLCVQTFMDAGAFYATALDICKDEGDGYAWRMAIGDHCDGWGTIVYDADYDVEILKDFDTPLIASYSYCYPKASGIANAPFFVGAEMNPWGDPFEIVFHQIEETNEFSSCVNTFYDAGASLNTALDICEDEGDGYAWRMAIGDHCDGWGTITYDNDTTVRIIKNFDAPSIASYSYCYPKASGIATAPFFVGAELTPYGELFEIEFLD